MCGRSKIKGVKIKPIHQYNKEFVSEEISYSDWEVVEQLNSCNKVIHHGFI